MAKKAKKHVTVRYKLYPRSKKKDEALKELAGASCFTWNQVLGQVYEERKWGEHPSTSFEDLGKRVKPLRERHPWLKGCSFTIHRYALKYLSDAFKEAAKKKRGRPKFKKRSETPLSFTIPQNVRIQGNQLYIEKVGWVQLRRSGGNQHEDGRPVKVTVKHEGDCWYAMVVYEVDAPAPLNNGKSLGIDSNCGNFAVTCTDGNQSLYIMPCTEKRGRDITAAKEHNAKAQIRELPNVVKNQRRDIEKEKHHQVRLANQVEGSNRYKKRQDIIRRNRQRNRPHDANHKSSRELSRQASTIYREDLDLKKMIRSKRGTVENPGTEVKFQQETNRKMQDAAIGHFFRLLEEKADTVKTVSPKDTSKTCSVCEHVEDANREGSIFMCMDPLCGHTDHADLNASAFILVSGLGTSSRKGEGSPLANRGIDTDCLVQSRI